jgi:uncharacterized protein YbjT (DUF2867 family)
MNIPSTQHIATGATQRQALVFGATGAVGSELLKLCLDGDRYRRVIVIARRPTSLKHEKLLWIEAGFDALNKLATVPGLLDGHAFCCLGTTIKAAGSASAFRRVDYDYVLNAARYAKKCGVIQFSMVTATGANPASRVLYSRTKGEIEAAVIADVGLRRYKPVEISRVARAMYVSADQDLPTGSPCIHESEDIQSY